MRFVFREKVELEKWINKFVQRKRYDCYVTDDDEIVLVPLMSTRPIKYAYANFDSKTIKEIISQLETIGIDIYRVKAVQWDAEKSPGVRVKID